MIFNWIGEGFEYNTKVSYFSINVDDVDLIFLFSDISEDNDRDFVIKRVKKSKNLIDITTEINEEVLSVSLVDTDKDFVKKFKRFYRLLIFKTSNYKVTMGSYSDNIHGDCYNILTTDHINIFYQPKNVTIGDLEGTCFEGLKCLFDKDELIKELLK